MTRYVSSHTGRAMHPEPYDINYGDDEEDEEDDFDDDDLDGYDGLSDYDEDYEVGQHHRSSSRHMTNCADDRVGGLSETRRQRSVNDSCGSLLEPGDDNRRDHHNQLERKRRASIKTSYNDLREAIPSLRGSKASRAVILQRAVECIDDLKKQNRDHMLCVETLRRQNGLLDSRVQEMHRLIQRLDEEEAATTVSASAAAHITIGNCTSSGTATNTTGSAGATLRLVSSSIGSSGIVNTGAGTTHLPVYRLMPQDSSASERYAGGNAVTHVFTSTAVALRSNALGSGHHGQANGNSSVVHTRTRVSPALNAPASYNGLSVLNTAANLVVSANSAFSLASSSVGSGGDVAALQSSSQRSSPGSYSSTSSTSSLGNQSALRPIHTHSFEELCDEGSAASASETISIPGQRKMKPVSMRCSSASSSVSSSSPPVPLLAPTLLPSVSLSHSSSPPSTVLAVVLNNLTNPSTSKDDDPVLKRQRLN